MDSPSLHINDIAEEQKQTLDKRNLKRRTNHNHHQLLSKNITPFKKKQFRTFRKKNMSLLFKRCLLRTKPSIFERDMSSVTKSIEETDQGDIFNLNFEPIQEEEIVCERNDVDDFLNQNRSFTSNHIDESESIYWINHNVEDQSLDELESIYSSDEAPENTSLDELESELHPFTHVSVKSVMLDFLKLIRQSQISKKEAGNFLSFIKSILPFPNHMPKDMNTLLKRLDITDYFKKTTICILCETELVKYPYSCQKCVTTEKNIAHIFDADIAALIGNIISRLSSYIEEYKKIILNPDPQTPYDIPFGKVYQHLLRQYSSENLLTLLLHVDGISLVKSTKLKLWICDASLIELPPILRHQRSNMLLVSMYIGYSEPNVKSWLKSAFSNIDLLKRTGLQLKNVQQNFSLKIYGCIADCPALKLMANMIGHTGYYPCFYCHIQGKHVREAAKRQYTYEVPVAYRTTKSFYFNSRKAEKNNQNILGHLGTSILHDIVDVPLPNSLIIDYAHVSLLRHFRDIVKTVTSSLSPSIRTQIDCSLRRQAFPHFFHRKLRGIADFSFIKAVELKNLLLYGFIPHFIHYLTVDQLSFLSLFIMGVRLIHTDDAFDPLTSAMAHRLLSTYYKDHYIYFLHHANFVLHLHQHFGKLYEFHGPLSSINTFAQEDYIGYIKTNKNGTTSFENLFAYYYNIDILLKTFHEENNMALRDSPHDLCLINQENSLFFDLFNYHKKKCNCNDYYRCVKTYRRCLISKKMFHSFQYMKRKSTISYFVKYLFGKSNFEFGSIKIFFQHDRKTYALIQNFQISHAFSDYFRKSPYYDLLKQPIDSFYFVLQETNINRVVSIDKIDKHMIIFPEILEKSFILATPTSSMTEHD